MGAPLIEYVRFGLDMAFMLGMMLGVIILDPIFVPAESHRIPDLNLDDSILNHLPSSDIHHFDFPRSFDKL